MAKLYLLQGWSQGGWPTLYLGGGGGWNAYHKKVNEFLKPAQKEVFPHPTHNKPNVQPGTPGKPLSITYSVNSPVLNLG